MGHQVVYCDQCGRMLREDDFNRGKAHTVENRSYCVECRPLPAAPAPTDLPPLTPRSFKSVSSTRIPKPTLTDTPRVPGEALAPASAAPSRTPLIVGLVVVAFVLVGAAALLLSGGKGGGGGSREVSVGIPTPPPAPHRPDPDPPPVVNPPPPPPPPPTAVNEEPAKAAFAKAMDVRKLNANDWAAQYRAFDDVVQKYPRTATADEARREIKTIQRQISEEIGRLYPQAGTHLASEQFKSAIEFWQQARGRFNLTDWTGAVDEKIKEVNDLAASRYPGIRARAADAKRLSALDEVKKQRERVVKWGLPGYVEDLDKTLAAVVPDKAEAVPIPATKEGESYRAAWRGAMELASRREYEAAGEALQKATASLKEAPVKAEAAADAEALRLAGAALAESRALLAKAAKGQAVSLTFVNDAGVRATAEGTVACTDGQRLEVRKGEETFLVLAGEVTGASLAELYRNRPGKKPEDARAAAFLCWIEGEPEAAKKIAVDAPVPDRYAELAAEVDFARRNPDEKEGEARRMFIDAETAYFNPLRTVEGVKLYKTLLADYSGTGFVRRNKGAISARTEGGKEYLLAAAELSATGNFKLAKYNNVESWMSTKDLEAASLKDSFVEISFSALADLEYRLWVQIGGCCHEVLTPHVQGIELLAPNPKKPAEMIAVPPGGDAVGMVKLPYLSLKKKHSDHTGPKEPDKWEWVQIPLQKYPAAGTKSVRLLTTQKGFSVAAAFVSALRPGPPKEADFREAERARAETPGYAYYHSLSETGGILREWWMNIGGTEVALLKNNPAYPDKPTGSAIETSFKAPMDWADNYGTRMRGWIHPPITGEYVFWITTDDQGELWLSSDDRPDAKVLQKIAFVPVYAGPNEWTKSPSQQSQPIPLIAGKRYYIEAFQKEGGGGDHLTVKWKLPDGKEENPIPGSRLSPWGGRKK